MYKKYIINTCILENISLQFYERFTKKIHQLFSDKVFESIEAFLSKM